MPTQPGPRKTNRTKTARSKAPEPSTTPPDDTAAVASSSTVEGGGSPAAPLRADVVIEEGRPTTGNTRALLARLPRYQQIAEELRVQIETGDLAPGQNLPSETALIDRYGVSRLTVRAAIRDLRAAGLIITEHGRASRVRDHAADLVPLDPTIQLAPDSDPSNPVRSWDTAWSDAEEPSRYRTTAKAVHGLNLPDATPVYATERLLTHDGATLAHAQYVPLNSCTTHPAVAADPFARPTTLYNALTNPTPSTTTAAGRTTPATATNSLATGMDSITWRDSISARMPTPDEAAALTIPAGVPVIVHTRTTTDTTGRTLLHEETRINPRRISLTPPSTTYPAPPRPAEASPMTVNHLPAPTRQPDTPADRTQPLTPSMATPSAAPLLSAPRS